MKEKLQNGDEEEQTMSRKASSCENDETWN